MSEQDEVMESLEPQPVTEDVAGAEKPKFETVKLVEGSEPEPEPAEVVVKTDLNTATESELQQLPGIGEALAARIVNYRVEVQPFQDPADLSAVPGVSEAMYARIADQITVSPAGPAVPAGLEELAGEAQEEELPLEPALAAAAVEAAEDLEPEPDVAEVVEKPPPGPEPPLVEVVQGPAGWGRILFIGFLSAIAGALLALGLLFVVNGTLDYQAAALRAAQAEVSRLEVELDTLTARLSQVEGGLGAIQELDSRLAGTQVGIQQLAEELEATRASMASMGETADALRQEFTNLREDMDGMAGHQSLLESRVGAVEDQLADLSQEIAAMDESVQRFDAFLNGLWELLNGSQGALGPAPTQWLTPEPEGTSALRPLVTVIPLATPTPTPRP